MTTIREYLLMLLILALLTIILLTQLPLITRTLSDGLTQPVSKPVKVTL